MDSEFRKKVFNEELFNLFLEIMDMGDTLAALPATAQLADLSQNSSLLRKTINEAFTICSTEAELFAYLKKLNLTNREPFKTLVPEFLEASNQTRRHSEAHFNDFLMTLRHLSEEMKNPQDHPWDAFFKTFHSLFACSEDIQNDFLMTVRHLTNPYFGFTSWSEFYKATTMLSGKSELILPFLTTVRHSLNYFKKPETFNAMFKTLSSQNQVSAFDAYSYGQLESKKWLIEEMQKVRGENWGSVFILAGWIGSLAQLVFDSANIQIAKIRSFDIDNDSCKLAEKLNNAEVLQDWKFKAVCMDILQMSYPTNYFVKRHDGSLVELYDEPQMIINTSCEHIEKLDDWWEKIPHGTTVALQNNNAFNIPDHKNCVNTLEDFKKQLPLSNLRFAGELDLPDYKRFMLIGEK